MYHHVASRPAGVARLGGLYVTPCQFTHQMSSLRLAGFQGLSVSAAMPYLRGERRRGRVVVITFDDGFVDNLENGLPILRRFGFGATCFAVSPGVGQCREWCDGPLMDPNQLRAWRSAGMEVGAHSRTHPYLTGCSEAELRYEVEGSRADLEQILGEPVTQFAYPYGDCDARVADAVRTAGYQGAVTTRSARVRPGEDPFLLPRVNVNGRNPLPVVLYKIFLSSVSGVPGRGSFRPLSPSQ
jgi:peptidoglycan/xylan/chitin deacetylase (PgdA/CDA1 family)